jgi:2-dehydro-3-deoxygalactonokinase
VEDNGTIIASGRTKVGVRDTSITGSREKLRNGVKDLFFRVIQENGLKDEDVKFAIASGMITSEIGLIEIPHVVAPAGMEELVDGIEKVEDPAVLPIGRPVYFIRGIRNHYLEHVRAQDLRQVDFMRGEEVQVMGILKMRNIPLPANIVTLSSHTKNIYVNADGKVEASCTTISGQFYEAMVNSTSIGKSIIPTEGEEAGGYTYEEMVEIAKECVDHGGLGRSMMMPRFLQVLMKTNSTEREIFTDAAIVADDIGSFREMKEQGYSSRYYLFYGQEGRCKMYKYMLQKELGEDVQIDIVYDSDEIDQFTIQGAIAVAAKIIEQND